MEQAVVGLALALRGFFSSVYGVLPGVPGWIGSLWIYSVEVRVVSLVYPPLDIGHKYVLGTVEAPWRGVSGRSPLELLGGSPLEQVGCSVTPCNMEELAAGD